MTTNNPIKVDLVIQCKVEQLYSDQVGGNPDGNLTAINNMVYQCVASRDNKYIFHYDQSNTKILNNSKYLGKGSNTVVMSVIQHAGIPDLNTKQFVMRVTELSHTFNTDKYLKDRIICGRYVPSLYYYGILYCDGGVMLNYVIAQKCEILSQAKIGQMSFSNKQLLLKDLVKCLTIIQNNDHVLWDLKIDNIGYANNYECVIIDYDDKTILNKTNLISTTTFLPTYYYLSSLAFENKYPSDILIENIQSNKIPVAGLADIILNLFFNVKQNGHVVNATLFHLHQGGLYSSPHNNSSSDFPSYAFAQTSNWWSESFLNLTNGSKIKEYLSLLATNDPWSDFHTKLINVLFDYESYTGLLSPEYSKIPYFDEVNLVLFPSQSSIQLPQVDPYDMVGGCQLKSFKNKYLKYKQKYLELKNK